MIELIYFMLCTPAFLFGVYILFAHDKVSYSKGKIKYNYPYSVYITLAVWWIVTTAYFASP